jgi:hypothetical protein
LAAHRAALEQLRAELAGPAALWEEMFGAARLMALVDEQAPHVVHALAFEADVRATYATDLLHLLGRPHRDVQWWTTPLGALLVGALGPLAPGVTHAEAAQLLDVVRSTVGKLVERGTLARAQDGGVALADVLERRRRLNPQE